MSQAKEELAAGRAAGYCWVQRESGPGLCTRSPGHDGPHVDYYNGRQSPADTEGYRWPNRGARST